MLSRKKQGLDFEKRLAKVTSSETIIGSGALWFAKGDVVDSANRWLFQCKSTKTKKYTLSVEDLLSLFRQVQDKNDSTLDLQFPWRPAFVVNFSSLNKTYVLTHTEVANEQVIRTMNKSITLPLDDLLQVDSFCIKLPECLNHFLSVSTLESFLSNQHKRNKQSTR